MNQRRLIVTATTAGLLGGSMLLGLPVAGAHPSSPPGQEKTVQLDASLHELNGSGASGTASAVVRNQLIRSIEVEAHGLSPDAPHAMHIHYGDDARNECPTAADATNTRGEDDMLRLSTADGLPAYGPIVVSLTTTGDTGPASALAVSRFPVSMGGSFDYARKNIEFTDVAGTGYGAGGSGTAKQIADAIRDGEGVVVIHGVDYNDNGRYDFESAGASELDPSLPAEATDPAACGVLR
ncbi:hypothetical protein [Blastococcus montanus]|uniref:hypothetical protein n=1 Tax=Blastococcus montanus TaxID=3144973 RepID=UPI00320823D1